MVGHYVFKPERLTGKQSHLGKVTVIQHIAVEHLGLFEKELKDREVDWVTFLYGRDYPPERLSGTDALIILGGPFGAYDEHPFLDGEKKIIREAAETETPTLGICLGAQLIAQATEGRAYKGKIREIGWSTITLTDEAPYDMLFQQIPRELDVFQWHGDTFTIPPSAKPLCTSTTYRNQAFRLGRKIYGLQFHIEVTSKMIEQWAKSYSSELKEAKMTVEELKKQTSQKWTSSQSRCKMIFGEFLRLAGLD